MNLLLVIAACIIACQADDVSTPSSSFLFNDRLDEVIRDTVEKHRSQISPYRTPDQSVGFNKTVGPLRLTGEVKFANNTIYGLEKIRRINDAYLQTLPNKDIELKLRLEIGPLVMHTDSHVKFLGIGPRISSKLELTHANANAVLHYNHKIEEVSVQSFEVVDLIGLKYRILRSPGFVTPFVANQIVNGALTVFSPIVKMGVTRAGNTILDYMVRDSELVKDLMTGHSGV